jgi:cbb3-type cytochrome oxidase maturation protein
VSALVYLIPVALLLGLVGLAAFLWALKSGQFEDLDGAAHRILLDDEEKPLPPENHQSLEEKQRYDPTVSR